MLRAIIARWPDTAVLVVTAVAEVESAVACLQLGALDYVAKPFHLDEVRARVMQALDKRRLKMELEDYRLRHGIDQPWETRERVVVALSGVPGAEHLLRRAANRVARQPELVVAELVAADHQRLGAARDVVVRDRRPQLAQSIEQAHVASMHAPPCVMLRP